MHFHIVIVIGMNMHKLGYKNYCCYKLYNIWDNSIRILAIENAYAWIYSLASAAIITGETTQTKSAKTIGTRRFLVLLLVVIKVVAL